MDIGKVLWNMRYNTKCENNKRFKMWTLTEKDCDIFVLGDEELQLWGANVLKLNNKLGEPYKKS